MDVGWRWCREHGAWALCLGVDPHDAGEGTRPEAHAESTVLVDGLHSNVWAVVIWSLQPGAIRSFQVGPPMRWLLLHASA